MSTPSDTGLDLEALELQLLPAWARQGPGTERFTQFEGDRGEAPGRRGPPAGRRPDRPPGRRPGGEPFRRGDDRSGRPQRDRGPRTGPARREDRPPPQPVALPDIGVTLIPEAKGVELLARQIRLTGRAYPIFEIAQLILRKGDRYSVRLSVRKKPDGQVIQPMWLCSLDDTLWLSEQDAVSHVLRRHFDTFYQAEKTPTDPPKGTYTFVAQCGLSGVILGPPNFHDYQAKLARLHASRYARMPFDAFKARVRIVRDEAVVKQWIEDQSFKTEYVCLNVPESLKLPTMADVETHFRQVHFANIIRTVEEWTTDGETAKRLATPALRQLIREAWEEQRRFPLRLVGVLSQQLASHGLQFFKVNRTVTHVSVARPHFLDTQATPVSDGVRRIVEHIDSHVGCNRRHLLEILVPAPAPRPSPEPEAAEPSAAVSNAEAPTETPAVGAESSGAPGPDAAPATETPESAPSEPQVAKAAPAAGPEPTPEQMAVTGDLHWLIHQGHVIEFANGRLETAKRPKPRPVAPPAPRVSPQPAVPTEGAGATGATPPEGEVAAEPQAAEEEHQTDAAGPAQEPDTDKDKTLEQGNETTPEPRAETSEAESPRDEEERLKGMPMPEETVDQASSPVAADPEKPAGSEPAKGA
jgi:hypothetical protein